MDKRGFWLSQIDRIYKRFDALNDLDNHSKKIRATLLIERGISPEEQSIKMLDEWDKKIRQGQRELEKDLEQANRKLKRAK